MNFLNNIFYDAQDNHFQTLKPLPMYKGRTNIVFKLIYDKH